MTVPSCTGDIKRNKLIIWLFVKLVQGFSPMSILSLEWPLNTDVTVQIESSHWSGPWIQVLLCRSCPLIGVALEYRCYCADRVLSLEWPLNTGATVQIVSSHWSGPWIQVLLCRSCPLIGVALEYRCYCADRVLSLEWPLNTGATVQIVSSHWSGPWIQVWLCRSCPLIGVALEYRCDCADRVLSLEWPLNTGVTSHHHGVNIIHFLQYSSRVSPIQSVAWRPVCCISFLYVSLAVILKSS